MITKELFFPFHNTKHIILNLCLYSVLIFKLSLPKALYYYIIVLYLPCLYTISALHVYTLHQYILDIILINDQRTSIKKIGIFVNTIHILNLCLLWAHFKQSLQVHNWYLCNENFFRGEYRVYLMDKFNIIILLRFLLKFHTYKRYEYVCVFSWTTIRLSQFVVYTSLF